MGGCRRGVTIPSVATSLLLATTIPSRSAQPFRSPRASSHWVAARLRPKLRPEGTWCALSCTKAPTLVVVGGAISAEDLERARAELLLHAEMI